MIYLWLAIQKWVIRTNFSCKILIFLPIGLIFSPCILFFSHSRNALSLHCLFFFLYFQNVLFLRKDSQNLRLQWPKCEPPTLQLWWSSSENRSNPSSERVQKKEKVKKKMSPTSKKSKLYITNTSLWLTLESQSKMVVLTIIFVTLFFILPYKLFH